MYSTEATKHVAAELSLSKVCVVKSSSSGTSSTSKVFTTVNGTARQTREEIKNLSFENR